MPGNYESPTGRGGSAFRIDRYFLVVLFCLSLIHRLAIKSARDGSQSCNSQRDSLAPRRLAPPEARPRGAAARLDAERGDPLRAALPRRWACFLGVLACELAPSSRREENKIYKLRAGAKQQKSHLSWSEKLHAGTKRAVYSKRTLLSKWTLCAH